jgi:hypothetical protein
MAPFLVPLPGRGLRNVGPVPRTGRKSPFEKGGLRGIYLISNPSYPPFAKGRNLLDLRPGGGELRGPALCTGSITLQGD